MYLRSNKEGENEVDKAVAPTPRPFHRIRYDFGMAKLCILVGSAVFSTAFWYIADWFGCEFFTSFLLSGLGAILGCWPGWLVYKRLVN